MASLISFLIYLSFFMLCFIIEVKRTKKWNATFYTKSRFDIKGVYTIYFISLIFMVFFMIINSIIGESIELCVCVTLSSCVILLLAFICSKICIVITNDEIIKKGIFGKTIIKIREVRSLEIGYFIKIKSKKELIQLETKFYDSEIEEVKKHLREVCIERK